MEGDDQARSVITGFGNTGASALSVQAVAEQLLAEESWPARLALLQNEPRLVDGAVARWCVERGDGLLAAVIMRAGEVGVEAACGELPSALALLRVSHDDSTGLVSLIHRSDIAAALRWQFGRGRSHRPYDHRARCRRLGLSRQRLHEAQAQSP